MALTNVPGAPFQIGPSLATLRTNASLANLSVIDAVNEASIFVGYVATSDGASHTIDTTGSSKLEWNSGALTFANAGTTVKVGLATVDLAAGPPARATNAANVITFSVSKTLVGGGGGITANANQSHVPDAGTLTVANGDFIAFAVQMTARGGTDSVVLRGVTGSPQHGAVVTQYAGGTYSLSGVQPNCFITFSDGATGYFYGSEIALTTATTTFNSGSATKEYGQLYNFPFPLKIIGAYGWVNPTNNFDVVLYSDPLGTPVAEKTVSVDANTVASAAARLIVTIFPTAYTYTANTNIVLAYKPGASNIAVYAKTIAAAAHRIADVHGTSGYGVSRATGAFSDIGSSLTHYYTGLLVSAVEAGATDTDRAATLVGGALVQ